MIENDAVEMTVDCFQLRYKPVVSHRFDSAGFKKTHADLYSQYTKETEYRRFSVAWGGGVQGRKKKRKPISATTDTGETQLGSHT